ncbi:structural polyprotein [Trema orientale]|uniref:Structural polyprotein n=1 Tax=Trema orientale TaxID=63057 RepID=A0A2P5BY59_TREOI|nr:structural polyprotein [Trema orientale]
MVLLIVITFIAMALISVPSLHAQDINGEIGGIGRRALLSFKETPHGSNATFECSPSGPCVPCLYSEKNDEKYRCSETGYRIPLKCVEIKHGSNDANGKVSRKSRSTLEIFPRNVKLHTVVHNLEEGIVFCLLLVSGSFIYFRKKRTAALSGFGRIQTNSRF